MGNTGMLGKVQIEGDWTQKRLILPVIQAALERTQLASPAIGPTMTYAKLKGTIPSSVLSRSSRSSTSSSTRSAVAVNVRVRHRGAQGPRGPVRFG